MLKVTLIVSGALIVLAFVALWLLPKPDALLSLSAKSGSISHQVVDPNASSIVLGGATLVTLSDDPFADEPTSSRCVSGLLMPRTTTEMKYEVLGSDGVAIRFGAYENGSTVASIETKEGELIDISEFDHLKLSPSNPNCDSTIAPLPVWGPGDIGSLRTFGSSQSANKELVSGEIIISARAIERLFYIIPGAKGLYEAGRISLPAGAQIRSFKTRIDDSPDPVLPWIGSARVVRNDAGALLQIDLSTENDTVWMWRAGSSAASSAIPIGASAFIRQTRDPGLVGLQIVFALILIVTQTVAALAQTVSGRDQV